jgi:hypothetical protein
LVVVVVVDDDDDDDSMKNVRDRLEHQGVGGRIILK